METEMVRMSWRPSWRPSWGTLLTMVVCVVGCGDDGKYTVSGSVTFQGAPVPSGEIRLTPDTSQGNRGPAVLAKIKDGQYQTPREKGVIGGAYQIRVSGYGAAANSLDPTAPNFGKPLFPVQLRDVELPLEDYTYDIEIE